MKRSKICTSDLNLEDISRLLEWYQNFTTSKFRSTPLSMGCRIVNRIIHGNFASQTSGGADVTCIRSIKVCLLNEQIIL